MDTLLYDADCGFCTQCAAWLAAHAPSLRVVPLTAPPPAAVDASRARREVPYLHADGHVSWGADAIGQSLLRCGGLPALLGRVVLDARVRPAARAVYGLVARYRHRLPGGTASCRLG